MLGGGHFPVDSGPLQHDEIDIGDAAPVRCLKNGLWLSLEKDLPFAIIMVSGGRFGLNSGVQVEIAVPAGERGAKFSQDCSTISIFWSARAGPTVAASFP